MGGGSLGVFNVSVCTQVQAPNAFTAGSLVPVLGCSTISGERWVVQVGVHIRPQVWDYHFITGDKSRKLLMRSGTMLNSHYPFLLTLLI